MNLNDKKGLATLNLFVLLFFLLLSIVGFSLFYYTSTVTAVENQIATAEVENAAYSLRSYLLEIVIYANQTHTYESYLTPLSIYGTLNGSSIELQQEINQKIVEEKVKVYGYEFCEVSDFSPGQKLQFSFNGSCIEKLS